MVNTHKDPPFFWRYDGRVAGERGTCGCPDRHHEHEQIHSIVVGAAGAVHEPNLWVHGNQAYHVIRGNWHHYQELDILSQKKSSVCFVPLFWQSLGTLTTCFFFVSWPSFVMMDKHAFTCFMDYNDVTNSKAAWWQGQARQKAKRYTQLVTRERTSSAVSASSLHLSCLTESRAKDQTSCLS